MNTQPPLTLQLTDHQVRVLNEGQDSGPAAYERALCQIYHQHGHRLPDWREVRVVRNTLIVTTQG